MANTHSFVIGTHCAFWDVDSLNLVGYNTTTDIDNGTFVALGAMNANTDGSVAGYEYAVTPAANADYIVATPAGAFNAETALYDDPRYFYNEAGRPMSVKRLLVGDCIEVPASAFTATPATTDTYAEVQASGKLTSSTTNTESFKIEATHTVDIGGVSVKTWILRKMK